MKTTSTLMFTSINHKYNFKLLLFLASTKIKLNLTVSHKHLVVGSERDNSACNLIEM